MKSRLLVLLLAFAPALAFGQGTAVTAVTATLGPGNLLRAIPFAPVVVCNYPAVGGPPCTNLATTYTSPTLATPCAAGTQVIAPRTTTCIGTSDATGNFEIFVGSSSAFTYYFKNSNTWYGPYVVTSGAPTGAVVQGTPEQIVVDANRVGLANPLSAPGPVVVPGITSIQGVPALTCLGPPNLNQISFWNDGTRDLPMFNDGTSSDCYTILIVKTQAGGYFDGQLLSWCASCDNNKGDWEPPTGTTITSAGISTLALIAASVNGDYQVDGTINTSLGAVISQAIAVAKLGGAVNDKKVGEIWATNPMPDNGFFKVQLPSGDATHPAVQTSAPVVMRGGNWLTGNGRKGSNTSSEWIGTRIIPSNTFPDAITPPTSAVTNFTCAGGSGSFSAGNYLVSAVFATNLQTYSGTSTIVPGLTNAGTEAIVTCPGTGTISFPAFNTNSATTFGTTSALLGFWAPVTNATTSYAGTIGSTCVLAPASCNVPITVTALTNASWARGFAVAKTGADCTNGGVGCAVIDVGASQEYQKIVAIDQINKKLILAGPMQHTHAQPYPIAPSYSETLQNTTAGGSAGSNVGCAGTNVGNNAFGQLFACRPTSGSAVATTLTLTSGVGNGNLPMPRINFTAPLVVGGSTGPLGTPEFDSRLTNLQISCRRPNGTIVNGGTSLVNLTIQEHGFTNSTFDRDCPNGMFIFGNQAQNSSYVMTEVNDGCASAQAANGCSGGASAITNNNYRILVQNVQPGPLGFDRISSSSANCLSTGCNYTQLTGSVLTIDHSSTDVGGVHGEGNINVISVENAGSVTARNASGGSSDNATVLAAFHIASDARTSSSLNEMASGAIESIQDDVFAGKPITTATNITGGAGGTTSIVVSDTSGLHCNQEWLLDSVASGVQEYVRVADYTATGTTQPAKSQCISGTTVTLAAPPVNSHSGTIPIVPQDTAFNEGTFVPTGRYEVSNPCSGCVNTSRDRGTTYNGVPTIQNGPAVFSSDVAGTVPWTIMPGPGVAQTADLANVDNTVGTRLLMAPSCSIRGIARVATGTATSAGTVINAGTSQNLTVNVSGATTTDVAICSTNTAYPATWQTGIQVLPPVVTANTVTLTFSNPTAGNITPVAQAFRCTIPR
jgi:hypothetical protein